jgi:hypothetical protein
VGRYKYTPANGVAFNEEELKVNEIPRTRAELLALKEAQGLELGFQMGTWQPRCPKVYVSRHPDRRMARTPRL